MSERSNDSSGWRTQLGRAWHAAALWLRRTFLRARVALANARRSMLHGKLPDYVVITLDEPLVELPPADPWWRRALPGYRAPVSLQGLRRTLRQIAGDPGVKGVLLLCKGASLRLSQAQSLAQLFDRFRAWDREDNWGAGRPPKQIAVYLESLSTPLYVAACAADRIFLPPLASWDILGLYVAPGFYRDTLALLGLEADVVQIAPWKSAADSLARAAMSDEVRDQYNWLLDSFYADIVGAIAAGRNLEEGTVRALIDRAPLSAPDALAAGLADALAYEDELPALLGSAETPARLAPLAKVRGLFLRRAVLRHDKAVGVIDISGTIVTGRGRDFPIPLPLLGEAVAGSTSVQQAARAARKDSRIAAVVVHVDSGGGSALASDLMWRELDLLAREKPLIVYMGAVAGSGGYYVAAPARAIVAQRATITGSIGVITAKVTTAGAYDKAHANREVVRRGANADLFADHAPWDASQRATVEESVRHIYAEFKARVASGRKLDPAGLDAIANGRVWSGAQAKELGLVDEIGDFRTALELACAAAGLPADGTVSLEYLSANHSALLARPLQAAPAALHLIPLLLRRDLAALQRGDRFWLLAQGYPQL